MKHGLWLFLISPFLSLLPGGCMSSAQFAVCGNGVLEPTEECSPNWDGTDRAEEWCTDHGFTGGSATCRTADCTWDTSTCTGNVNNINNTNNVNNVNNVNCDPLDFEFSDCQAELQCYYNPNTSSLSCETPGEGGLGVACGVSSECTPYMVCLENVCTQICGNGLVDCDYGMACTLGYWIDDNWGYCPLVDTGCDPFTGEGCPGEDNACYFFYDSLWHTACLPAGPESVVCVGTEANECFPGFYCHVGQCLPLCDSEHPCHDGTCVVAGGETGVCQ